jgi:uncharacterized membrane protein YeaQ/YmgE (transglycosylase-associated protein family)
VALVLLLILGFCAGMLAHGLVPEERRPRWPRAGLLGLAGAAFGWSLGRVARIYRSAAEFHPAALVMAALGAILLVSVGEIIARWPRRRAA